MNNDLLNDVLYVVEEINAVAEKGYEAMYDYLSETLDIEFRCGSRKDFRSAEFAVAVGGPNIYVDTNGNVNGYWGGDHYQRSISKEAENMIYDIAKEWFQEDY